MDTISDTAADTEAATAVAIVVAIAVHIDGPMPMDTVESIAADTAVGDTQRADITVSTTARGTDTVVLAIAITTAATGMDGPGGRERSLTPIMTTIITMIITMHHRQQVAVARQSIAPASPVGVILAPTMLDACATITAHLDNISVRPAVCFGWPATV